MMETMTELHAERLDRVAALIAASGAQRVLDLGCGAGTLLARLLGGEFTELVGVEQSAARLNSARQQLAELDQGALDSGRLRLINGSYMDEPLALTGFDAAAMVETIEHVPLNRLQQVEQVVFGRWRPGCLVMTTPNQEYNVLYGMAPGEFREADHQFEWDRLRFRRWARGVAARQGYQVRFSGIGDADPEYGPPTQVAIFECSQDQC